MQTAEFQPLLLEGQRVHPCERFPYRPATDLPHVMVTACFNQSSTKNGVHEIPLAHSAALRSTMGCTVLRESLRHCQISGQRGRENGLPTRSLDQNENSREKSQTAVFLR